MEGRRRGQVVGGEGEGLKRATAPTRSGWLSAFWR